MNFEYLLLGFTDGSSGIYDWCPEPPCTKSGHAGQLHHWSSGMRAKPLKGRAFDEYWGGITFPTEKAADEYYADPNNPDAKKFRATFRDITIVRVVKS